MSKDISLGTIFHADLEKSYPLLNLKLVLSFVKFKTWKKYYFKEKINIYFFDIPASPVGTKYMGKSKSI